MDKKLINMFCGPRIGKRKVIKKPKTIAANKLEIGPAKDTKALDNLIFLRL